VSWLSPDSEGMLAATAALPDDLVAAAQLAAEAPEVPSADGMESLVVLGMGGSSVAGEVLQAVGAGQLRLPLVLVGDYRLPAFVGPKTIVFAVSFSGDTEETLSAASGALERGARLVAITRGGKLAELASGNGAPVLPVAGDAPQPRAAIGAMAATLLVACERAGLLEGVEEAISAAAGQLRRRRDSLVRGAGVALEMSRRIDRTIPLVQGAAGVGAVAARRWKTQFNENAKTPAFFAVQPEWSHNEVCGFGQNGDVTRQVMTIVELRSDFEHDRMERRFGLVEELVGEAVASVLEVRAEGDGPLAQLFDLVMIGDFVSLHCASREGIDPGPVPALVELKRRLAG
jgi:glucose/mannose-6-phosphate isomerase